MSPSTITNAAKHAAATQVSLELAYEGDDDVDAVGRQVRLAIRDDGTGAETLTGGHGLSNIEKRVESIQGTVTFGNRETGGFAITVQVPA